MLTKTRWLLLKRPENLADKRGIKLTDLLQYNLRSMHTYLLKEEGFQFFVMLSRPTGRAGSWINDDTYDAIEKSSR